MELLKQRIMQDGRCYPGGILKVDSFINHQMDPMLMYKIGEEFIKRFSNEDMVLLRLLWWDIFCSCRLSLSRKRNRRPWKTC